MAQMMYSATTPNDCRCQLVLASRSPRRAQLLRDAGYAFCQLDPPYADPPQPAHDSACQGEMDPGALASSLAERKARSMVPHVAANSIILAADTICVGHDQRLLGQPLGVDEARQMICGFFGAAHAVVTGVAVREPNGRMHVFCDQAMVHLDPLDNETLERYLASGQWRGKAGGYNLFDRQADGWPIQTSGDPTTIVGLPMDQLLPLLVKLKAPKAASRVAATP